MSNSSYEQYIVKHAPPSVYYIPNFVTEQEEKYITQKIYDAPKPKWVQLTNRRLQNWGGLPDPKGMWPQDIPKFLKDIMDKIDLLKAFDGKLSNHVLVNEYHCNQGIMPHVDGPLFYPTVTTVSLGSSTMLDFYTPVNTENLSKTSIDTCDISSRYIGSIFLERRSLVIIKDEMYTHYLHGIKEAQSDIVDEMTLNKNDIDHSINKCIDRDTRLSLTIRHVPIVCKKNFFKIK